MADLKPMTVTVWFPAGMDISEERARWYIENAIGNNWKRFATESDPIREMRRAALDATETGGAHPGGNHDT